VIAGVEPLIRFGGWSTPSPHVLAAYEHHGINNPYVCLGERDDLLLIAREDQLEILAAFMAEHYGKYITYSPKIEINNVIAWDVHIVDYLESIIIHSTKPTIVLEKGETEEVFSFDLIGLDEFKMATYGLKKGDEITVIGNEYLLPVQEDHFYLYTFEGLFQKPPVYNKAVFEKLEHSDSLKLEIKYHLARELESFIIIIQQYDKNERILSVSSHMPNHKGSFLYQQSFIVNPDATSFRLYLRIVNHEDWNSLYLKSIQLKGIRGYLPVDIN